MRLAGVAAASLAFAGLAVAVALGGFHGLDQHAVAHWMPGLTPGGDSTLADALLPVHGSDAGWLVVADIWLYPASAPGSLLLVCLAAFALHRRGTRAAYLWPAALLVGTLVEVVVKEALVRPALYDDGVHVTGFDHALPSGHTLRSALVAAAIAYAWPRLAVPALLWAATAPPLLVLAGWHTPTDVVAGLLLAALLVLGVHELLRRRQHLQRRPVDRAALGTAARDQHDPAAVDAQSEA